MQSHADKTVTQLYALPRTDRIAEMTDEAFVATVDAYNSLINQYDEAGKDRTLLREELGTLFDQYPRRINGKKDILEARTLILSLRDFIYGRSISRADRGPEEWREFYRSALNRYIDAARSNPPQDTPDYLIMLALHIMQKDITGKDISADSHEFTTLLTTLLDGMEECGENEKRRRLHVWRFAQSILPTPHNARWLHHLHSTI